MVFRVLFLLCVIECKMVNFGWKLIIEMVCCNKIDLYKIVVRKWNIVIFDLCR